MIETSDINLAAMTEHFWDILKTVNDPEIGINMVDLGLIYAVDVTTANDDKYNVNVDMTLTSPTCPLADSIIDDIKTAIKRSNIASDVTVNIVFDPPWNQDMITADGKMQLGLI